MFVFCCHCHIDVSTCAIFTWSWLVVDGFQQKNRSKYLSGLPRNKGLSEADQGQLYSAQQGCSINCGKNVIFYHTMWKNHGLFLFSPHFPVATPCLSSCLWFFQLRHNLSLVLVALGQPKEAREELRLARRGLALLYGAEHPLVTCGGRLRRVSQLVLGWKV